MDRILLTGFDGENNSARIIAEKISIPCRKLILPNDKTKSVELLHKTLEDKDICCVIMLGQKTVIKDKIAVEPIAKRGENILHTSLDVTACVKLLENSGYNGYISKGAGNSYCNNIYYECLETGVNCLFLHVPTEENISDIEKITGAIERFLNGISTIPATI